MKLIKKTVLFASMAALLASTNGYADDVESAAPAPAVPFASWIEPVASESAPWLDGTVNEETATGAEILAAGGGHVLVRRGDQIVVTDAGLHEIAPLLVPENLQWISLDEKSRVLAFDGQKLLFAQSVEAAAADNGFMSALDLAGVTKIDNIDATVVYANAKTLTFANLDQLTNTSFELANFFDDAKMATLTPDAVAAAKNKSSKKAKSASKKASAADNNAMLDIEVQALAVRADNTVVVRVRRMLDSRVFVTRDQGASWTQLADSPNVIMRQLGWIWDGASKVLSQDGMTWVDVCGERVDLTARYAPSSSPVAFDAVELTSAYPASPAAPTPVVADATAAAPVSAESAGEGEARADASTDAPQCVTVPEIPVMRADAFQPVPLATSYLAPQAMVRTGDRYYFTNEGTKVGASSRLWMRGAGTPSPVEVALPQGCDPVFVESQNGLAVLLCRQNDNPEGYLTAYSRMTASDWMNESLLPESVGVNTRFQMANDGTIVLAGDCVLEQTPERPAQFDADGNVVVEAQPGKTQNICTAAVRNAVIDSEEAWHLQNLENVETFHAAANGQLLAVVNNGNDSQALVEMKPHLTRTVVDTFDASAYDGLIYTSDGCFALYDAQNADDRSRLLTPEGGLSGLDCASSREMRIAQAQAEALGEADQAIGDNHYGMRLGVGGFFASGIQTWSMRVEGLIPIYGGQYEVGLLFRMAGGNESSSMGYLGLVSARWRYDQFEHVDFAVGAGIGYGQLTGYVKRTEECKTCEKKANGETTLVETDKSKKYREANSASIRYLISGIFAYKLSPQWKLYLGAELIGGLSWGFDINGGIEIRF